MTSSNVPDRESLRWGFPPSVAWQRRCEIPVSRTQQKLESSRFQHQDLAKYPPVEFNI